MLRREDILALYEQGPEAVVAAILALQEQLDRQARQIARLEERLGLDSHNSSKPPSSDLPGSPGKKSRAERRAEKRATPKKRSGGGSTLKRVETPDEVVVHSPDACMGCGKDISDLEASTGTASRQVFDIEPIRLRVVEHQLGTRLCGCGTENTGEYPSQIKAPTQYGENILALALLLMSGHHLPLGRTAEIIKELSGLAPSEATLLSAVERLDAAIDEPIEATITGLLGAHQLFVDETGMNVKGEQWWLHVAATEKLTHLAIDRHRGQRAIEEIGILPLYDGYLMHDYWSGYNVAEGALHCYCTAHLLRELVRCCERTQISSRSRRFASELITIFTEAIAARRTALLAGVTSVEAGVIASLRRRYAWWVNRGLKIFGAAASGQNTHEHRLLRRLQRDREEILGFLEDVRLEPTNNIAERSFRFAKLRQKTSGCFRSERMAGIYARVQSYLLTARKQGSTLYAAIRGALCGEPFMPVVEGT